MSTQIAEINRRILVTQFCGGGGRLSVQITECRTLAMDNYVQLSREEAESLVVVLNRWLRGIGGPVPF